MRPFVCSALMSLLFACGGGAGTPPADAPDGADDVPDTHVYELPPEIEAGPTRPTNATCVAPERPAPPGHIRLTPVFEDLLTEEQRKRIIGGVYSVEAGGRWYLTRQPGELLTFTEGDGAALVALDLTDRVWLGHPEVGLVSVAIHPDFADNGYAFLVYSVPDGNGFASRVARFESLDGGLTFEPDSERVVLDVKQPHGSHSGNHVVFGPDGYLYFSLGDGRNPNDVLGHGQNVNTLYGAILRLDVDTDDDTPYAIPPDNPFADGGGAPEIFAYGLRNPWRFSIDRVTGEVWAGDVGQDGREEVDLIVSGGNYGWSIKEGSHCFQKDTCDATGLIDPVWDYPREGGSSVTGGFVYRGAAIPALYGRYVFGDYTSGNIWALQETADGVAADTQLESGLAIASFIEGPDAELYVVHYGPSKPGGLYRIDPAPEAPDTFPQRLSETGCVDPDAPALPAPGVIPYGVNAALWSDGADKDRFLAVPDVHRIEVDEEGDLHLPVGSVLMKHFRYGERLHETRLLVHHTDGWAGYSYEWLPDQSDARLLQLGRSVTLDDGRGGSVTWRYPSRSQCMQCHTEAAGRALGPELRQLDGLWDHGDGPVNQVEQLLAWDYFMPDHETPADLGVGERPSLPDPFGDAPLEARARAYLHANCSHCHRPGSNTTQAHIDLRFDTPFAETGLCDAMPEHGTFWLNRPDWRLVAPGKPDDSLLYLRMVRRDGFRMPPLASEVVDEAAAELIRAWITALDGCPPEAPER